MEVLFKTVHGSRLYGLAHAGSDEDFYTVVSKVKTARAKYAKQSIVDGVDSVVVDFGTWLYQCEAGVPQALEAMFSYMQIGEDKLKDFRRGFRAGTQTWERYLRTIKSFALDEDNNYKKKRHALRLAWNLNELAKYGRFNPTLSEYDIKNINSLALLPPEDVYETALWAAWGGVDKLQPV